MYAVRMYTTSVYTVQQVYKPIFLVHRKSVHCVVYFINQSHLHLKRFSQKKSSEVLQNTTGEKSTESNIHTLPWY